MFILDTNVLSALMSATPPPEVAAWIAQKTLEQLFTVSVREAEILTALAIMPDGRRRLALQAAAIAMFRDDFDGHVLPFDRHAACEYAGLFAAKRQAGKPIATLDLMIAAVARSRGANVVTRDSGGCEGCGLSVTNPWAGL
jgi:predicted nucleic acid-binding protein